MPKQQRATKVVFEQSARLLERMAVRAEARKKEVADALDSQRHFFGLCVGLCDCKVLRQEYQVICLIVARVVIAYDSITMFPTFESIRFARDFLWGVMKLSVASSKYSKYELRGRAQAFRQLVDDRTFTRGDLSILRDNLDFLQGRLPHRKKAVASAQRPTGQL